MVLPAFTRIHPRMLESTCTAVPAFTVGGVPAAAMVLAGIAITATLIAAVLVLSGIRQPQTVSAR